MLRPRVVRRSLDVALLCALAAVFAAPRADAHVPEPGAKFTSHDHSTPGDEWHIEVTVAKDSTKVRQLVLHDERCRATLLTSNLTIRDDGTIDSAKPFTSRGRPGTWWLKATFTNPRHLTGSFQLTAGGCTGRERSFRAHAGGHHGGGHSHHHQHLSGTRPGRYPDLARASRTARAQARALWRASLRQARGRFATYARARRLGFVAQRGLPSRRPQLFHLRHGGYAATPRSFDAARPESLVYWNPAEAGRDPVLIAYMFRLATGVRPRFAAPLLGWHAHGGRSQMTHVWLTGDLRTALANCMPVEALEAAIPAYRFDPAGRPGSPESIPCPAAATAAANRSVRVGDNWFVRRRGVPTVSVRRGDRVTWRFTGREPHNVVSQGGPARFSSPTRRSGTYARRMTRSGTYSIVCTIHGGRDQRMRLVVR